MLDETKEKTIMSAFFFCFIFKKDNSVLVVAGQHKILI